MSDLTDATLDPAYLVVLLHNYGQAHAAQYRRPSDEGNQALGDAARAIYAYTDAREAAARADERAKVAEEIAKAIETKRGDRCPECGGKPYSSKALRSIPPRIRMKCGGGHTWDVPGGLAAHPNQWCATDAAAIARQHAANTCTHQPHEVTSLSKPHREFLCGRCGHAWTEPWTKNPSHGNSAHAPGEQPRDGTNKAPESHQDATEPQPPYRRTPKPAQAN